MITVGIADDHNILRQGLRVLLEWTGDFRVIGEAEDGIQAVEMVESLKPDVVVVDVMMPKLNGLEVIRQASRCSPQTALVVLSMYQDEAYVIEALRAGARAYVLKSATSDELVTAIREAAAGRRYLSPPLSQLAIQAYIQTAQDSAFDLPELLTSREREVFQLAAEGYTTAQIAEMLSISQRTAQTHRTNLMQKLGLRSQTELVRYAVRHGIIAYDSWSVR
ncbi:MAG: DNA-binding response regulator [Chloroflexi bacterium]|nr:MAG: DNA-binding response regulator [Chloroflexota bacterium]